MWGEAPGQGSSPKEDLCSLGCCWTRQWDKQVLRQHERLQPLPGAGGQPGQQGPEQPQQNPGGPSVLWGGLSALPGDRRCGQRGQEGAGPREAAQGEAGGCRRPHWEHINLQACLHT